MLIPPLIVRSNLCNFINNQDWKSATTMDDNRLDDNAHNSNTAAAAATTTTKRSDRVEQNNKNK